MLWRRRQRWHPAPAIPPLHPPRCTIAEPVAAPGRRGRRAAEPAVPTAPTVQDRPAVPTLEVVAHRAGVSRATASRVLTGSPNVSPASRDAVLAASTELGYLPNRAARSLVTRRSGSVAFVVSETEERLFTDPFFLSLMRGAHAEVADRGYQLLFSIASTEPERRKLLSFAGGGHLDGIVLVSLHGADPLPELLERRGVPVVLLGRPYARRSAAGRASGQPMNFYVDADNRAGARAATELLLARGARHLVHLSGPRDMGAGQDRLAGFRDALRRAGLPFVPRHVQGGDFSTPTGYRAMCSLLETCPEVDGVFAASDLMAVGALQALAEAGRAVPDDTALVGFDDAPISAVTVPRLTTVRQPIDAMGRRMAQSLLDRLEGLDVERALVLPTEIVHRDSA